MRSSQWMILGATGTTGRYIVAEAVRRGHHPILAGRSATTLQPLADALGLESRVVNLADPAALAASLQGVGAVCHAAGSYLTTTPAIVAACLATRTAYLDIANEIPALDYLQSCNAAARAAHIPLLFGAGFGVVAATCLAQYVVDQLPTANELRCATHIGTQQRGGTGVTQTGLDILRGGGRVIRKGRLVPFRLGRGAQIIPFADAARPAIPAPFGDLAVLMQTGVPNITFYSTALPTGNASALLPLIRRALRIPMVRRRVARQTAHAETHTAVEHSQAWAWVRDAAGQTREAWLTMGDGYAFTASSSVLSVEAILAGDFVGTLTPAQAFGTDFVLQTPGTERLTILAAR